jgi:hypothetical protein
MLDPLEYANQLEKHGLSRPLAELIARGSLSRPSDVATKEDIARLEGRISAVEGRLSAVEGKLSVLLWVVGGVGFSIFLAILALLFRLYQPTP